MNPPEFDLDRVPKKTNEDVRWLKYSNNSYHLEIYDKFTNKRVELFAYQHIMPQGNGKYAGKHFDDIPPEYIRWASEHYPNDRIKKRVNAYLSLLPK